MQLGMIGLGRMGGNIVRRLMKNGHSCVVYDKSADTVREFAGEGAAPSKDLADFVKQLDGAAGGVGHAAGGPDHRCDDYRTQRSARQRATSSSTAAIRFIRTIFVTPSS